MANFWIRSLGRWCSKWKEFATPRVEGKREKVRTKEGPGSGGWCTLGAGVGGPCNDLTAVVTFLISARFNYTVDEEGARPPLACVPFLHDFHVRSVTASSSFPHQSLVQTRPVVLTRHRLANKIWLIAPERFLLRSLLPFAANPAENFGIFL